MRHHRKENLKAQLSEAEDASRITHNSCGITGRNRRGIKTVYSFRCGLSLRPARQLSSKAKLLEIVQSGNSTVRPFKIS